MSRIRNPGCNTNPSLKIAEPAAVAGNSDWRRGNSDWRRGNSDWRRGNSDWKRTEVDERGNSDWRRSDAQSRGNSDWKRSDTVENRGNSDWRRDAALPERALLDNRGNSDWRRDEIDARGAGNSDWKRTASEEARGNSDWRRQESKQVCLANVQHSHLHFLTVCSRRELLLQRSTNASHPPPRSTQFMTWNSYPHSCGLFIVYSGLLSYECTLPHTLRYSFRS